MITAPFFLALVAFGADGPTKFTDVQIEPEFEHYLVTNPLLMEVAGAKIIRLAKGRSVVLGIASTALQDDTPKERLRAEKVCRAKALANVVAQKSGVQVAHFERLKEKTVIVLESEKETAKSVSELLQVTKSTIEGVAKDMPVIATWKSKDGSVFYLAIGIVCDERGALESDPPK